MEPLERIAPAWNTSPTARVEGVRDRTPGGQEQRERRPRRDRDVEDDDAVVVDLDESIDPASRDAPGPAITGDDDPHVDISA